MEKRTARGVKTRSAGKAGGAKKPALVPRAAPAGNMWLELFLFAAVFALVFFSAGWAFSELRVLKVAAAFSSQAVLSVAGVSSSIDFSADDPLIVSGRFVAEIGQLCAASTELAVLLGIIVASRDRSWAYRLKGILAGFALVLVFNPVRIAVTLLFYDARSPVASSLFHDVLFRVSIIVFIVAFYGVWYYWGVPAGKVGGKRKR
ncbi:MAG: exosortase/archaeosortase family protein [Candidatus Micrarchaeia archaeon]|jgi:exosortase/archaeosortase family protein